MSIPADVITSVRERISIAEIIGEQIQLKRVGKNFVGLCPFHSEKTPSFNVREEEGTYYCFGCGKKGSVFDYIMETRGYAFREAVTYLANRIGIKIPEQEVWSRSQSSQEKTKTELLRRSLFAVAQCYSELLWEDSLGEKARDYLTGRGITEATARRFHLGFSPVVWDFIVPRLMNRSDLRQTYKLPEDEKSLRQLLRDVGVIKAKASNQGEGSESTDAPPNSGYFDIFRGRLIFGITRSDGAIIGLGGRLIEKREDSPKYINSQESAIYHKRKSFFGVSQALGELRRSGTAILVEGYMDVLSMVQRGFGNTIATCGTAITEDHVVILKKMVTRATVMFDGDVAGRRAAARCFEVFLNSGIDVQVVFLPDGEDPDSLARTKSREELEAIFTAGRRELLEVFVESLLGDTEEGGSAQRARSADAVVRSLLKVKNPVERELLTRRSAELLGVSEQTFQELIDRKLAPAVRTTAKAPDTSMQGSSSLQPSWQPPWQSTRRPKAGFSRDGDRQGARRGRNPIVSAPPVTTRTVAPQDQLAEFYRSLVVVTAMVPALAKKLLAQRLPDAAELVVSSLPARFQDYLCDVGELCPETITSLSSPSSRDNSAAPNSSTTSDLSREQTAVILDHNSPGYAEWSRLLEKVGYKLEEIHRESLRRLELFKGDPRRLCEEILSEAPRFAVRRSLIEDVEKLRESERKHSDPVERARILQERVSKKREIEQISKAKKQE